jgi:hypothetical protein
MKAFASTTKGQPDEFFDAAGETIVTFRVTERQEVVRFPGLWRLSGYKTPITP